MCIHKYTNYCCDTATINIFSGLVSHNQEITDIIPIDLTSCIRDCNLGMNLVEPFRFLIRIPENISLFLQVYLRWIRESVRHEYPVRYLINDKEKREILKTL